MVGLLLILWMISLQVVLSNDCDDLQTIANTEHVRPTTIMASRSSTNELIINSFDGNADAVVRIYSASKIVSAALTMRLYELKTY